jgi:hypothetical protein
MFACTDATTDANVWTNVGAGEGNVIPYNWGGTSYGYVVGGYNVYHGIDRFSLASGTNNAVIGTVTTIAFGHATYGYHAQGGSSSDTHLYGVGGQGWHGGQHIWSMVSKTLSYVPFYRTAWMVSGYAVMIIGVLLITGYNPFKDSDEFDINGYQS